MISTRLVRTDVIRTLVQLVVPKYVPACPDRKEAVTAIQVRRKGLAVKRMERVRCFTSYQSVTVTTLASQGPRPYEPRRKWSTFFPLSVRKLGTSSPWARDDCNDCQLTPSSWMTHDETTHDDATDTEHLELCTPRD